MFCWEARAALDRTEAGWVAGSELRRLQAHLDRCPDCHENRSRRERLTTLVRDAGRIEPPLVPDGFEMTVLRAARARRRELAPSSPAMPRLAPLPAAAALVVVLASAVLAMLGGAPSGAGPQQASLGASPSEMDDSFELDDRLAAPAEIPFVVRQDLVGDRRGRIPMTSYVMEPPPAQPATIMRASL
ncbi:MAG: hypothetical protein ACREAA_06240 [Candidatus Polarisedimenticolia bacterium]